MKDFFVTTSLHETLLKILDTFMSMGSPKQWISYLMSEDLQIYDHVSTSGGSGSQAPFVHSKFEQLMLETRAVISRYSCCLLVLYLLLYLIINNIWKFESDSLRLPLSFLTRMHCYDIEVSKEAHVLTFFNLYFLGKISQC